MLAGDFLGGFWICVVDNPLTGYLFLLDVAALLFRVTLFVDSDERLVVSLGCFGKTKALVCFNKYRSLHSAEINGKSKLRLFSRSVRISSITSSLLSSLSSMALLDIAIIVVADEEAPEDAKEADGNG